MLYPWSHTSFFFNNRRIISENYFEKISSDVTACWKHMFEIILNNLTLKSNRLCLFPFCISMTAKSACAYHRCWKHSRKTRHLFERKSVFISFQSTYLWRVMMKELSENRERENTSSWGTDTWKEQSNRTCWVAILKIRSAKKKRIVQISLMQLN